MLVRQEVREVGLLILYTCQSPTGLALSFFPRHSQDVVNIYLALVLELLTVIMIISCSVPAMYEARRVTFT